MAQRNSLLACGITILLFISSQITKGVKGVKVASVKNFHIIFFYWTKICYHNKKSDKSTCCCCRALCSVPATCVLNIAETLFLGHVF